MGQLSLHDRRTAGFNLGGGVRAIEAYYGDNETMRNKAVTLLDLTAGYEFGAVNPRLWGLRLDLNVTNLADKKYLGCS